MGYEKAWGPEHTSTLDTVNNVAALFSKRCYAAAKISRRNMVLAYIKQLADLCMKFPRSRLRLLDAVGRGFAWMGDDGNTAAAFAHQLALSSPECHAYCDDCGIDLTLGTGRLICKVCENGDLCRSCFEKLESNESSETLSLCRTHKFIDIVSSSSTDDAYTGVSSEQWLQDLANI